MRCLYCDRPIEKGSFKSLFLQSDQLCTDCRKQLKVHHQVIRKQGLLIETFFDYDSLFRSLLLQYKECCDEALKTVFLYDLADYFKIRYHTYKIIFVPSCQEKREKRGFDHLAGIFECTGLKEAKGLRMKQEWSQEGKDRRQRLLMADNYVYEGERQKKVLLVDDVVTTGASLAGACRAIAPYVEKTVVLSLTNKKEK